MPAFDVSTLPSVPFDAYKTLPAISAVYFCLTQEKQVLYIGSTWHLRRRWCNHHRRERLALQGGSTIAWIPCPIAELDAMELPLIARYLPPLNHFRSRPRAPQNSVTVIERQCVQCGLSFYVRPSQLAHGPYLYCSHRCASEGKRGRILAQRTEYVCGYCERTFVVSKDQMNAGKRLFCSQTCSSRAVVIAPAIRFWSRVARCAHAPWCLYCCWLWQGEVRPDGYGRLSVWSKSKPAHRYSWELHNGYDFPSEHRTWVIRHLCHTRCCVNPWHLMKGTYKENTADARMAGRLYRRQRLPIKSD